MSGVGRAALSAAAVVAWLACAAAGAAEYLYVWTVGVEGAGDGSDKLVTIDATRVSERYGRVIHQVSVGGRGELATLSLGADGRTLRAVRASDARMFEFDVAADPARPRMRRAGAAPAGGEAQREVRAGNRVYVAGVQLRDDPDALHFVRAYTRDGDALTIAFEVDFRAPRLGLPRALVLLER